MSRNRYPAFPKFAPALLTPALPGSVISLYTASAAPGETLPGGGLVFFGIVFFGTGLVSVFYPRLFWWLRIGRKVKDAVPAPLYLATIRLGGVLLCAVALLILFGVL
jgi:hypothetical protein